MKNKTQEIIEYSEKPVAIQDEAERLIAMAIDKNVPVESLERLLAMRRELKAEHAKEEYDKAMASFQANCPTIKKTKAGGKTKGGQIAYYYAPLESIVEQVKDPLKENGFSYSVNQKPLEAGMVSVALKVTHKAGHNETTDVNVPLGTKTEIMSMTQQVAAALTFAKRYAFCNAFGILTGDEDTDAQSVSNSAGSGRADVAENVVARTSRSVNPDVCEICHAKGKYHRPDCPNKE